MKTNLVACFALTVIVFVGFFTGCDELNGSLPNGVKSQITNEGSIAEPISVELDVERASEVGPYVSSEQRGDSYYVFTTTAAGMYTIYLTGFDPDRSTFGGGTAGIQTDAFRVSDDTAVLGGGYYYNTTNTHLNVSLTEATAYYVRVRNWEDFGVTFTLEISKD